MLKENALIMFDEETKSVWSHLTGEALGGPLKGRRLRRIAAVPRVRWSRVKSEYPRAKVLQVDGSVAAPLSSYAAYHAGSEIGVRPMATPEDGRLAPKAMVAGVAIGEGAKAYAHDLVARKRVVNDVVGGIPLVVARDESAEAVVVYDRRVAGRTLRFEAPADGRIRDVETGTTWSVLRGVAREGALRGRALTRLPHVDLYWFGWHAYYPRTKLYRE
jgi:hypothetical protein